MTEEQLSSLLNDMTTKEKINQMIQLYGSFYEKGTSVVTGPISDTIGAMKLSEDEISQIGSALSVVGAKETKEMQRHYLEKQPHKIPLLFMADIINGYRTIIPIPIAQACSFNPEMVQNSAAMVAKESAVAGVHVTFSPVADLARDPRWGRVMETAGEDPYLNCVMTEAVVKGYQGENLLGKGSIAACIKHFAGYGAPVAGREYNNVELSERTLNEFYLPGYAAGIKAGAALVMTSFNTLDHIPSTGNQKLMKEILRQKMKFEGVLISDWNAIGEMIAFDFAEDEKEAAELAMKAGVDIDMMSSCYASSLEELIKEGIISNEELDESVIRILRLKNDLGLFENPYKDADEELEEKIILCDDHRILAKEAAKETFVLLKNEGILPLDENNSETIYIGPYVNATNTNGNWAIFGQEEDTVTLRKGILNVTGNPSIPFYEGCSMLNPDEYILDLNRRKSIGLSAEENARLIETAVSAAKTAKTVVLALGEHHGHSGEAGSRAIPELPDIQKKLFNSIYEVNQNIIVVLYSGRPLIITEIAKKAKAILQVWFPGTEGGNAVAEVLYGRTAPSGKLCMSFPYAVGQIPVFYNEHGVGRPQSGEHEERFYSCYLDIPNEPLYPFGYGLSYTEFSYGEGRLDKQSMKKGEKITASITVENIGQYEGKEIVQLYIHDCKASTVRPVKELKGFQKIALNPGEKRVVSFAITEEMLRFYTKNMLYASEPGEFEVMLGTDSTVTRKMIFRLN